MDTVVVEVIALFVRYIGSSVFNQVKHEIVTNDGCGEVVRVCALVGGFYCPNEIVHFMVNVCLDGGEVEC